MTTTQKIAVATLILAAAGASVMYEAQRASRLERKLEALERQQPPQVSEKPPPEAQGKSTVAPARSAGTFGWRQVESVDYRQYIANLRAIGCPQETIQDLIVADVNTLFASRAQELRAASTNHYEYWKPSSIGFGSAMNQEMVGNMQELAQEKRALLKTLLGAEVPERLEAWPAGMNPFETMLDFLPIEKQNRAMLAEQQLTARMAQTAQEVAQGNYAGRDRASAEREAELSKILTPEEKFDYDLRMSPSAAMSLSLHFRRHWRRASEAGHWPLRASIEEIDNALLNIN